MTPDFRIVAAGVNITPQIKDRLLSLVVVDEVGFKSDTVEITLDDRNNVLDLPAPGASLAVCMGYKETFLAPIGIYTADEIVTKGPPDTIIIRGKAANLGGTIKEQKTRNWDDVTLHDIVSKIAGEHGLKAQVADAFRSFRYDHLVQTDESDMHLLTRIAKNHDALATVKGNTLLFIGRGEGKTASGTPMPPREVHKSGKISYSMTMATRGNYASVEATWHNQDTGTKDTVTAGDGSPVKKLRHIYSTKVEAERAAKAKLSELNRGNHTLRIMMHGDPTLAAEGQIVPVGFRAGVAPLWSVTRVRHELKSSGYTTQIETEKPKDEGK